MASGPSGLSNCASKGFDFRSDDVLCSYEDFTEQDSSNANHIDPSKDFHISRITKAATLPATAYSSPEGSLGQDVIATVEKSIKTYSDNLMRFLEGIGSRLSQLELYCYNLDKSIGEMRSDLNSDHEETDSKLKSIEKHVQEVHRSVQILKDKQELADAQKELAKLQLVQKESSSSRQQSYEERSSPSAMDQKRTDNASEANNQQLALALPHQVAFQQQPVAAPSQAPASNVTQATQQLSYYVLPASLPNPPAMTHLPQNQYLSSDPQYRNPQPTSSQVTMSPPVQQFSQYQQPQQPQQQQQHWPQQSPQEVAPPQPPSMQFQMRPSSTNSYTPYLTSQAANPPPKETLPNSLPMQMQYSGIPPPGSSRGAATPYGYNGTGRSTVPQQPPPQQIKSSFPAQPGDMYGTHTTPPPGSSYLTFDSEGGRAHYTAQHSSHYAQAGYPPTSASLQNPAPHNLMARNPSQPPQFTRSHPYNDLIEKLVNMGFRGDHVGSVIQRMEETGQPVDFNSLLDRLNVHSSVGPQRGW